MIAFCQDFDKDELEAVDEDGKVILTFELSFSIGDNFGYWLRLYYKPSTPRAKQEEIKNMTEETHFAVAELKHELKSLSFPDVVQVGSSSLSFTFTAETGVGENGRGRVGSYSLLAHTQN